MGSRRAVAMLPPPGGATRSIACWPAAAISSARRVHAGRGMSARSTSAVRWVGDGALARFSLRPPRRCSLTSCKCSATRTSSPGTRAASASLPRGTMARETPHATTARNAGKTPRTGRTAPLDESPPRQTVWATASLGSSPSPPSAAMTTARSNIRSLWMSAGATSILMMPSLQYGRHERTRTRVSRTLPSERPRMRSSAGPGSIVATTLTGGAASPASEAEKTVQVSGFNASADARPSEPQPRSR